MKAAELDATIGSPDFVTIDDPPSRWRAPLQKLQDALAASEKLERRLRLVGPGIAIAAFLVLEGAHLTLNEWSLAATVGAGVTAAIFTRSAEMRAAANVLAALLTFALQMMHDLSGYITLGLLVSIAVNYALEKTYPALAQRERITALQRHFLPHEPEPHR